MEAGRIIGGKYRLRREIGSGAMGAVWAAVHESLGRSVAVKFLSASTRVNPDTAAARFVAEARMAAAVKHRFVVDIFDFGITEDGLSYMVLELLEGEELGERMYYGPPMDVRTAVRFICACLSGLDEVHESGIVHRDLKPENIFILQDADGPYPKLLDFGISKLAADGSSMNGISMRPQRTGGRPQQLTMPGTVIGTPWYMSPEQLRGRQDLDPRADLYAVGVILWEWLVGVVPHQEESVGDLLLRIVGRGPPDLVQERPELGFGLRDAIRRALATERDARFQSAKEMRDALLSLLPALPMQEFTAVQRTVLERHKGTQEAAQTLTLGPLDTLGKLPPPPGLGALATVAGQGARVDITPRYTPVEEAAEDDRPTLDRSAPGPGNAPALAAVLTSLRRHLPRHPAPTRALAAASGAFGILLGLSMYASWEQPPLQREVLLPNAAARAPGPATSRSHLVTDAAADAEGRTAMGATGQAGSADGPAVDPSAPAAHPADAGTPDAGAPAGVRRPRVRRPSRLRKLFRSLDF